LYTIFILGVSLISLVFIVMAFVLMISEVIGKGKKNGTENVMKFGLYGMFFGAFAGYLMSSPPLTWGAVGLIGKALLTLFLVVTLHEIGHFVAAKVFHVPVHSFSVGIGPKLYQFQFAGTSFQFNLLPVKGKVVPDQEKEEQLPLLLKCIVYLAGIVINIVCFFIGLTIYFIQQGQTILESFVIVYHKFVGVLPKFYAFIMNIHLSDIYSPEKDLENSIGVYISATDIAQEFWVGFAVLSLMAALFNLIPIPVLDGGRVVLAIFISLLGLVGVSKKIITTVFYTLIVAGALVIYSPIVINNLWSSSQSAGMNLLEHILWIGIIVTGLINIQSFFENRKSKIKPIE
jgi:membrane-associated protease RseP (regulator of RpoE activity)